MNIRKLNALVAAFALSLTAFTAHAEDFTITVPVEATNLPPNINGMLVGCLVYTNEPRLGGRNIGAGTARQDISGGAFRGNVVLRFNVTPGQDPGAARHYECSSSFVGTEGASTVHYFASYATSTTFPLAAGAPFRLTTGVQALPR